MEYEGEEQSGKGKSQCKGPRCAGARRVAGSGRRQVIVGSPSSLPPFLPSSLSPSRLPSNIYFVSLPCQVPH